MATILQRHEDGVPSNRVRVLVAVSDRLYLDALCHALTGSDDIVLVAETTDARRAVELAADSRPDVAVIESVIWTRRPSRFVSTVRRTGIGLVLLVRSSDRNTVTEFDIPEATSETIYVHEPLNVLLDAIGTAAHSKDRVRNVRAASEPMDKPTSVLTPQELEVLRLLAEGFTTKEISSELGVAVRTVENHRMHLAKKLDIHSVVGLTRYAIRHRVINP